MFRSINIQSARKANGIVVATLAAATLEALAYVQDVGINATAKAIGAQAWGMTARVAIQLQTDYSDIPERLIAFQEHNDAVIAEMRGAAIQDMVSDLNLHRDVKEGKDENKAQLTKLQSTIKKAQVQQKNYTSRITNAWANGLLVDFDTNKAGEIVGVESANKLAHRAQVAAAAGVVQTPDATVKATAGRFASEVSELASGCTRESCDAVTGLLAAINVLLLQHAAKVVSNEELNDLSKSILDTFGPSAELTAPTEDETEESEENLAEVA